MTLELPQPELPHLPARRADAHKGSFGQALLIGGSRGMSGAIGLAGMAAAQAGAGLVRLAVPGTCLETVASYSPCYMTIPVSVDEFGRIAATFAELALRVEQATCIAVGPGLGQSAALVQLISDLIRTARCPVLLDADALNNLAHIPNWSDLTKNTHLPLILTPHPGEWQRLSGAAAMNRQLQSQKAVEFARETRSVVVLKGQHTLVTDGLSAVLNSTGTPAMATGGSGDVLTGIITALVCQGLGPRDAAHLAVFVHGKAAEIAAQEQQSHVVLPNTLVQYLAQGFRAASAASATPAE